MAILRGSMQYDKYLRGLADLRELLWSGNSQSIGQFGRFNINSRSENRRRRRLLFTGIYDANVDHVVALINRSGKVFMNPNSVYLTALLGSEKHIVVKGTNMTRYDREIPGHLRIELQLNVAMRDAVDEALKRGDEIGEYKILHTPHTMFDIDYVQHMFKIGLEVFKDKLPNTYRSAKDYKNYIVAQSEYDGVRIYINVKDYSEEIAREAKMNDAKDAILRYLADNYDKLREDSIWNNSENPNPFCVTYFIDGVRYRALVDTGPIRSIINGASVESKRSSINLKEYSEEQERQDIANMQHQNAMDGMRMVYNESMMRRMQTYHTEPGGLMPVFYDEYTTADVSPFGTSRLEPVFTENTTSVPVDPWANANAISSSLTADGVMAAAEEMIRNDAVMPSVADTTIDW